MTPLQSERTEVLRRTAERGKARALLHVERNGAWYAEEFVDIFQHLLDEIQRLKNGI